MAIMLVVQLAQPPRNYQQHRVAILWKQHQLAAGSPGESHLRLGDTKKKRDLGDSPTWVWCVIMISPMKHDNFKGYTIRYIYPVFRRTQFDISTFSIIVGRMMPMLEYLSRGLRLAARISQVGRMPHAWKTF